MQCSSINTMDNVILVEDTLIQMFGSKGLYASRTGSIQSVFLFFDKLSGETKPYMPIQDIGGTYYAGKQII